MPEAHTHLQPWSLPVVVTAALAVAALVYSRGWWRLRSALPGTIPMWRLAVFVAGLFFLWIAGASPLSALDHVSLTIHMINHLVLMLVAAPLILAGTPILPMLLGLPARFERGLQSFFLNNPPVRWLTHVLRYPVFCWFFAAGAVIGWHVPAAFHLALRSHWWHGVEYACFTLAGLLFWRPVMNAESAWPRWSIPLYLFLATLPCDILSAFLAFCDRVVYPSYLSAPHLFNLSPLEDQQCASALMWVSVTIFYLIPAAAITIRNLSPRGAYSQQAAQGLPDESPSPLIRSRAEVT
jgi:putative membrane protein